MKGVTALLAGILFGVGLAMSGMTDTAKVQGFLDLFGAWVPDLAFVMGGAVAVTLIVFRYVLGRDRPVLESKFFVPSSTSLDRPLLQGSALFGIGWGLYGYCPGPAIAALAYMHWQALVFVLAMLAGMFVQGKLAANRSPANA